MAHQSQASGWAEGRPRLQAERGRVPGAQKAGDGAGHSGSQPPALTSASAGPPGTAKGMAAAASRGGAHRICHWEAKSSACDLMKDTGRCAPAITDLGTPGPCGQRRQHASPLSSPTLTTQGQPSRGIPRLGCCQKGRRAGHQRGQLAQADTWGGHQPHFLPGVAGGCCTPPHARPQPPAAVTLAHPAGSPAASPRGLQPRPVRARAGMRQASPSRAGRTEAPPLFSGPGQVTEPKVSPTGPAEPAHIPRPRPRPGQSGRGVGGPPSWASLTQEARPGCFPRGYSSSAPQGAAHPHRLSQGTPGYLCLPTGLLAAAPCRVSGHTGPHVAVNMGTHSSVARDNSHSVCTKRQTLSGSQELGRAGEEAVGCGRPVGRVGGEEAWSPNTEAPIG